MKKFLTLLFAFTCLAFSEMRGQNVFISPCCDNGQSGPYYKMQTIDGNIFTYTFNGINFYPLRFNESFSNDENNPFPLISSFKATTFPTGIASEQAGNFPGSFGGIVSLTYNKSTKEYYLSTNCGSYYSFNGNEFKNGPTIYGNSCKLELLSSGYSFFQWKRNGVNIAGANQSTYVHPPELTDPSYVYSCEAFCDLYNDTLISNELVVQTGTPTINLTAEQLIACDPLKLRLNINRPYPYWNVEWKKNGQVIQGENSLFYSAPPSSQDAVYSASISCPNTAYTDQSNVISSPGCFSDATSAINYLLVQNVTTTGNNASNKTIQVQFDLSWGNTGWDDINWDAAWVFMKYKTASGEWKHAKINPTGYDKGQGSPSIIQPTADKMGAFVRLGQKGQGNFNAQGIQLQWNYGLDGLNSVNGLEVKVFATEMVYQPQGDFTVSRGFRVMNSYDNLFNPDSTIDYFLSASGNNVAIINSRLTPKLTAPGISGIRIKGDAGLDLDSNGTIDNTTYPTGYYPFYLFKYEMSEQAYADFLNCLNQVQVSNLGIAGTSISLNQGQYFAASPNRACKGANAQRLLAYADWSGLRPASYLELNKAYNGPNSPNSGFGIFNFSTWTYSSEPKYSVHYYNGSNTGNPGFNNGVPFNSSGNQGRGLFGAKDLIGNVWEPFVLLNIGFDFQAINGDGVLSSGGTSDQTSWNVNSIKWGNFSHQYNCEKYYREFPYVETYNFQCYGEWGFRLCRSAE